MKVLLVNTSERIGGAAVSCGRLMSALNANGVSAKMLVRDKQSTDNFSVLPLPRSWKLAWHFLWERFVIWKTNHFSKPNLFAVDIANAGTDITRLPDFKQADIVHLHWINQGMLSLKGIEKILKSGKPIVWTMHDMWPCTGICHHARECNAYQTECCNCPYLSGKSKRHDLAYRIFKKKKKLMQRYSNLHFVACSQWMAQRAQMSALLQSHKISCIPNPISTHLYRPADKQEARIRLGLPADKQLLLFGSVRITDKRKGIDYLIESCKLLSELHPQLTDSLALVVVGSNFERFPTELPFQVFPIGFVSDDHKMADVYNACDVYVTPSLEENLPNTIMEAMACGVPCVGFNIGGIPEMIDHLRNGYVAEYKSAADLCHGIYTILTADDYSWLSDEAVHKVATTYSEQVVARRFIELYNQISGSSYA